MEFTMLEDAVIVSALRRYAEFCTERRYNPENKDQLTSIDADIKISKALCDRLRDHYLSLRGAPDRI